MSKQKIIGIFGCEQTDICIYLASILENMKTHVLVVDNSFEQKMQFCIPRPEKQLPIVTYKNVDYMLHCDKDAWSVTGYDYIIINLGSWPGEEDLEACDELLGVMNCELAQIINYRELIGKLKRPTSIVFRNYCRRYMDARKITEQLGVDNCFVAEHFFLPFSEEDECCRLTMQAEGYQSFTNISKEFEKALFRICRTICNQDFSKVLGGLRRAKKGECF